MKFESVISFLSALHIRTCNMFIYTVHLDHLISAIIGKLLKTNLKNCPLLYPLSYCILVWHKIMKHQITITNNKRILQIMYTSSTNGSITQGFVYVSHRYTSGKLKKI